MPSQKRGNRDRLAGESHKLDFVTLAVVVDVHDSPHVSGGEPFFRHVFSKHYDVVFLDQAAVSSRVCVISRAVTGLT